MVQLSLKNVSEIAHISRRKSLDFSLSLSLSLEITSPGTYSIATNTTKYTTGTATLSQPVDDFSRTFGAVGRTTTD